MDVKLTSKWRRDDCILHTCHHIDPLRFISRTVRPKLFRAGGFGDRSACIFGKVGHRQGVWTPFQSSEYN